MTGGGGAILRCSAPPAASCPTYDDAPVEITLLWSATLTVGERGSGTTVLGAGFNRGNSEPEIGAISDDSFDLTGAPHVVTQLQIFFPTVNNELSLTLDTAIGEEADQLILHLDSVSLPLRNATVTRRISILLDQPRPHLVRQRIRRGEAHRVPAAERLRLQDHLDGADDGGGFPTVYCFRIQPY